MLWIADVYRPCSVVIRKGNRLHEVKVDHIFIQVLLGLIQTKHPLPVDFGLSVRGEQDLRRLKRAYSPGILSLLPWVKTQKPEMYIPIGNTRYRIDGGVLHRVGGSLLVRAMVPQRDIASLQKTLADMPGVFHSNHPTSRITEALAWMEAHYPKAYRRYLTNPRSV